MMYSFKIYGIGILMSLYLFQGFHSDARSRLAVTASGNGIGTMAFEMNGETRNMVDEGSALGTLRLRYEKSSGVFDFSTGSNLSAVLSNRNGEIQLYWQMPGGVRLYERFYEKADSVFWNIEIFNRSGSRVKLTDLAFHLPVGGLDEDVAAKDNYNLHQSVNLDATFFYWAPYSGQGDHLVMIPYDGTSVEYATDDNWYFIHSSTSVDRQGDSWRLPSSSVEVAPHEKVCYGFKFFRTGGRESVPDILYSEGLLNVLVVPGMVVPRGEEVRFALRAKSGIDDVSAEFQERTSLNELSGGKDGYEIFSVKFDRLGENALEVNYGGDKRCMLDFFVTEPVEELIKKRSSFIVNRQQHRDTSKWYDGLYSLYDMSSGELLSPEYLQDLREPFMVGGSDDPSNSKPMFVSEKNVAYPDSSEIASLEYYEENFVWGKLQRTAEEYPYPYGIYGSDNWYRNRRGADGDYGSGGNGKERMWRTFDYTTHFAIYYNLYLIAKDNPQWVHYLDAAGYLDRAFNTAMAFFKVPYNIMMGSQWSFHGWCDWAYKQGNFHERYILDIIRALEECGRKQDADKLRREWEKKVTYMIYEDEWPFGSEMFVDRTAFESSYYVGQYALETDMVPQEQFWYDKNKHRWYSYTSYGKEKMKDFMQNQLDANLALRGIYEPGYDRCGTAWTGTRTALDYMSQMGGAALLDYAVRFADKPYEYVRYGYNSILSSWALMNTGDKESGFGYWHGGEEKDGAAGWAFCIYQHSHPYMMYINTGRGPWRYDGEIDHGFTGGVHGAGCYLVRDPLFGDIVYGGRLLDSEGEWRITPLDGVRRYLAVPDLGRFEMELGNNGFSREHDIVVSKDLEYIEATVERRGCSSEQRIVLTNLPYGRYSFEHGDGRKSEVEVDSKYTYLTFGMNAETEKFYIRKL